MRISAAIIALAVLGAGAPAMAQTPAADTSAEAPVSTANSTSSAPMTTGQQIDRYLATSPALAPPADGTGEGGPRRIHGEVGLSVGAGDYRSGYAVVSIPLGETGNLDLAYSQTHNGDARYVYDPAYGYGYGAAPLPLASPMDGRGAFSSGCEPGFGGERRFVTDPGGALRPMPERCPAR